MQAFTDFFRWLAQAHGVNLTIAYDAYDRARFLEGLVGTIKLSVLAVAFSIAIGLVGAAGLGSRSTLVRQVIHGYVALFRNTPPLIQLYFFYFAFGGLLSQAVYGSGARLPILSNTSWAIISLSLFGCAFNVEIFRAGIEAVPKTMVEAAESLGYSRLKSYWHIVMPLALRISLPALNNNLVNLVKTTTLAYAIGVPELLYACSQIWSESLNVRVMMNVMLVCYVLLIAVLVYMMGRWERALRIPGYMPK